MEEHEFKQSAKARDSTVLTGMLTIFGSRYSRMNQVKFVEDSFLKILLGPFFNTLMISDYCFHFTRLGKWTEQINSLVCI